MQLTPDTVTAAAAVVVAVLALGISLWQAALSRQHNRLSVRPHLRVDWVFEDVGDRTEVKVMLSNSGLGPAILQKFEWLVDANRIGSTFQDTLPALMSSLPLDRWDPHLYTPAPGDPMSPGEKHDLFVAVVQDGADSDDLEVLLGRLAIRVEYSSMYEEKFKLDHVVEIVPPNLQPSTAGSVLGSRG